MSETNNDNTNTKTKLPYNFKLDFPDQPFTVHMLMSQNSGAQYETVYKRVQKALASNLIHIVGKSAPKESQRGAHRILYARINAVTSAVNVTPTSVDAAV